MSRSETLKSARRKKKRKIMNRILALTFFLLIAVLGMFIWETLGGPEILNKPQTAAPSARGTSAPAETATPETSDSPGTTATVPSAKPQTAIPDRETITIDFVGDIMLGSNVGVLL